jgi:hypothetical protein
LINNSDNSRTNQHEDGTFAAKKKRTVKFRKAAAVQLGFDRAMAMRHKGVASRLDGRSCFGMGGKSGLHGNAVAANGRRG